MFLIFRKLQLWNSSKNFIRLRQRKMSVFDEKGKRSNSRPTGTWKIQNPRESCHHGKLSSGLRGKSAYEENVWNREIFLLVSTPFLLSLIIAPSWEDTQLVLQNGCHFHSLHLLPLAEVRTYIYIYITSMYSLKKLQSRREKYGNL